MRYYITIYIHNLTVLFIFCSEESEVHIYSVASEGDKKYEVVKKFELTDCPAYESTTIELATCPAYYPVVNTVNEEGSYDVIM